MSFSQTVPVVTAAIAAVLFVAAPASAQSSMAVTSNQAGPHSSMMAKNGPTPEARPSTTAQAPAGGTHGSGLMAKAGNQLK